MLVVNLFGAPGAGKSTGAAQIFANLKMAGINAELVTEYAKDRVWEEDNSALGDQIYMFAKQEHRLHRLRWKVDVVVTDSPVMLSGFYNRDPVIQDELEALIKKVHQSYDNINIFIDRVKPYNPVGRLQTEDESDAIAKRLERYLDRQGVTCFHFPGVQESYERIVEAAIRIVYKQRSKPE